MSKQLQLWILPDRRQSDELNVIWRGSKYRLSEVIDVRKLPRELVLGVPEELVIKYGPGKLIYAQLIREDREQFLSLSSCCGVDKEGRIVHLTYLEVTALSDKPVLDWPTEGLPEECSTQATDIKKRIELRTDIWARGIWRMLRVADRTRSIRSFANIETRKAQFPPVWTPQKVRGRRIQLILGLVAAAVAAIVWYLFHDR
jgi:hypothetical protein